MKLEASPPKSELGKILIDGDVLCYRAAWSADKKSLVDAKRKISEVLNWTLNNASTSIEYDDYHVYLTGNGNFRFDVAVTAPYKGNRDDTPKPRYLKDVREYLMRAHPTTVSSGEEADDLLAIAATKHGPSAIIASNDKDMRQVPCFHYNFNTDEWYSVTEFEGLVSFYQQILIGDRVDNIFGLKGIGKAKSARMLAGCETEEDLWGTVLEAYDGNRERVVENARLVWLRRQEGEIWLPPTERNQ